MIIDAQQRDKILAAHFAATHLSESTLDFKAFVHRMHRENKYDQLKLWWNDMDALRVIRDAEHYIRSKNSEKEQSIESTENLFVGENGFVQLKEKPIGKIYNFYRIVLPQEMQIKIAYDSLIARFWTFVQQEKCAIRLSENDLTIRIFIPLTDSNIGFDIISEWDEFIKFAYSKNELYKSFVIFVNHIRIAQTSRPGAGVGYVRFPPATKEMANYLAAFYFANLENRILYDKVYTDSSKANQNAKAKVEEYQDRVSQSTLSPKKQVSDEKKLDEWQTKLSQAKVILRDVKQTNQIELKRSLSELYEEIGEKNFEHIQNLSRQFIGTARMQFGPSVKPKSKNGEIESTIIDILNEPLAPPACPLVSIKQIPSFLERKAGDMNSANFCYSCGKLFSKESQKYKANRFVLATPSKRPQSGGSETRPNICGECMTVAFACPVKLTSGSVVVKLAPSGQADQSFSVENHLRMLTLGELNLVAGRYLLINCREFVGHGSSRKPVSEKIGQLQYTLWQVARIFPTAALQTMKFILIADGTEIPLESRHFVWLSLLNEIFSPKLVIGKRDNIPLGQAIRFVQKDEVILAIDRLVKAKDAQAKPLTDQSYSEKRSLEELREKHCTLLKDSSKGDKLMEKQAELYRDVAALTGLTYAYCQYIFRLLKESKGDEKAQKEIKKLIENVDNPSFFSYGAAHVLPNPRITMYRNDDNYFCFDQAKSLLAELTGREGHKQKAQDALEISFDDILNAYAKLSEKHNKEQWGNLSYQLKLSLYARFPILFKKEINKNAK